MGYLRKCMICKKMGYWESSELYINKIITIYNNIFTEYINIIFLILIYNFRLEYKQN